MHNSEESQLRGQIEVLEIRIEELELQNESLKSGFSDLRLKKAEHQKLETSTNYLKNFIAAALFPLAAGIFRAIYRRIYGLKK